jgi:hypothetical protein
MSTKTDLAATPKTSKRRNALLWTVQGVLAALFVFAGGSKLAMPIADLEQSGLPGAFLRFIGVAELLGGLGLILPGVLRIRVGLTPLAAAGLVVIMIGATVLTLASPQPATAVIPFVVGLLAVLIVRGRWQRTANRAPALQPGY